MSATPSSPERPSEARLEALREEARRNGRVSGAGVTPSGSPFPGRPHADTGSGSGQPGYYGRPLLKAPIWTWEIPVYFFVGGLAGMAAVIAFAALSAAGDIALTRAALWLGLAGAVVSPVLLTLDLGRPALFLNMLRVFKWRSAMSMGVWILLGFSLCIGPAALLGEWIFQHTPGSPRWIMVLLAIFTGAAAILGTLLATYTGVLIGATAIPAWASHHRLLPVHFGTAALGAAAGALELMGFQERALPLLGLAMASLETLLWLSLELRRHGRADHAVRHGRSGLILRCASSMAGPLTLVCRLLGWSHGGAIFFLAGALLSRFGWVEAGRASATDPTAALAMQTDDRQRA